MLQFCAGIAATMGLSSAAGVRMAEAAIAPARPPVIWLHGQECTGCTESLLRSYHPTLESILLDVISLDYHDTLCVGAGKQALDYKHAMMEKNKGKYVLVTEGGTPMKDGGIYCKVGGKTQVELVREAAEGAAAIIAIGSCASWGGIQSADPNPTGAVGTQTVIPGKLVINIPGCPPSPYNFLSTVLYLLTFNRPPELDQQNRPKFAYGRSDPRELRAAAAFRCRALRARVRRRRPPSGLLPLQDRVQGSGDLRKLPVDRFRRRRLRLVAGWNRASLLWLHREGNRFPQAAACARHGQDPDAADRLSAGRRREGPRNQCRRRGSGWRGGRSGCGRRRDAAQADGRRQKQRTGFDKRAGLTMTDVDRRNFLIGSGFATAAAVAPAEAAAIARPPKQMPPQAVGMLYDSTLCIGCKACVAACKSANNMPADIPEHLSGWNESTWDSAEDLSGRTLNVIKVYRNGTVEQKDREIDGFAFVKRHCLHCVDPSCVSVCPVSAMKKDPVTGIVSHDADACIGCRYCVYQLPVRGSAIRPEQSIRKDRKMPILQPPAERRQGSRLLRRVSDRGIAVRHRQGSRAGDRTAISRTDRHSVSVPARQARPGSAAQRRDDSGLHQGELRRT